MSMKKASCFFILLCLCGLLFGCETGKEGSAGENEKAKINFIDDDGIEINMGKSAERIISLYSAHTENLYYLGAGDKIIGRYKTCTYPPEAVLREKFDYNGDPEKLISANPDLVIIRPFIRKKAPDYIKAVENAGIKVVSLYPDKFDKFDEYINKLALLTGKEENAGKLLSDFHKELDEIRNITSKIADKKTIFFESTETNVRTVTADSMAGLAMELAGGVNIAKDAPPADSGSSIGEFGEERVLENANKIDVYVSQRGSMNSGAGKQGINERAGFDTVKAIKEGRFFTINEKLVSSPSFRYTKGVKELARYLYPEIINDISQYENDNPATRKSFADIIFKYRNIPVFIPSSSSYYDTERKGHVFGLFEDVNWRNEEFDSIETVVSAGIIEGFKENGKEYFYPDKNVTRDELAQAVFVMGDFSSNNKNTPIADISESKHQNIVKILVDNNVFNLKDGKFMPNENVTNNEIISVLKKITAVHGN